MKEAKLKAGETYRKKSILKINWGNKRILTMKKERIKSEENADEL